MMIPCPECKRMISDLARQCPKCGAPITVDQAENAKRRMNRNRRAAWIIIVLAVVTFIVVSVAIAETEKDVVFQRYNGSVAQVEEWMRTSEFSSSQVFHWGNLVKKTNGEYVQIVTITNPTDTLTFRIDNQGNVISVFQWSTQAEVKK